MATPDLQLASPWKATFFLGQVSAERETGGYPRRSEPRASHSLFTHFSACQRSWTAVRARAAYSRHASSAPSPLPVGGEHGVRRKQLRGPHVRVVRVNSGAQKAARARREAPLPGSS